MFFFLEESLSALRKNIIVILNKKRQSIIKASDCLLKIDIYIYAYILINCFKVLLI